MLNWYRAARFIVPPPGAAAALPDWVLEPFPKVEIPTLVVWGLEDLALLPVQLDGLDAWTTISRSVRLPDVGHFAPWEAGEQVAQALEPFLARSGDI